MSETCQVIPKTTPTTVERPYKRWDPRLKVKIPVSIKRDGDWERLVSGNISVRGLFIETRHPLPRGETLQLSVLLVDSNERIALDAEVMHIVPPDDVHRIPGMGVKFKRADFEQRRRWRRFIDWV